MHWVEDQRTLDWMFLFAFSFNSALSMVCISLGTFKTNTAGITEERKGKHAFPHYKVGLLREAFHQRVNMKVLGRFAKTLHSSVNFSATSTADWMSLQPVVVLLTECKNNSCKLVFSKAEHFIVVIINHLN